MEVEWGRLISALHALFSVAFGRCLPVPTNSSNTRLNSVALATVSVSNQLFTKDLFLLPQLSRFSVSRSL